MDIMVLSYIYYILYSLQLTVFTDVIKLLFSTSADKPAPELINAINDAGNTPLHWAALNGHLESVKLLIQSGADITIFNRAGHDAVFEAEINDKKEVVDWLLGAVEELENGIGQTGEASGDVDENMDDEDKVVSQASTAAVEDVRKQMEDMKTKEGA
jgi:ankyrin repeat protein